MSHWKDAGPRMPHLGAMPPLRGSQGDLRGQLGSRGPESVQPFLLFLQQPLLRTVLPRCCPSSLTPIMFNVSQPACDTGIVILFRR